MSYETQGARTTPIEPGIIARMGRRLRSTLDVWFGPDQPMQPSAPVGTPVRLTDYPTAYNTNIQPRILEPISFDQMRSISDSFDLVRLCIETRKDQVSRMPWSFRVKACLGADDSQRKFGSAAVVPNSDPRLQELTDFFSCPVPVLFSVLVNVTGEGRDCALIDVSDGFDPGISKTAGADLTRLFVGKVSGSQSVMIKKTVWLLFQNQQMELSR
jgi:hypothetical protein